MIYIAFDSIRSHSVTSEARADQPYVIVTSVALGGNPNSVPHSNAYLYGSFLQVNEREAYYPGFQSFWGLNGDERALSHPDEAVFLVSLVKNDHGKAENLRRNIAQAAIKALSATLGKPREMRMRRLQQEINTVRRKHDGFATKADQNTAQELCFMPDDIALAESGKAAFRSLHFKEAGRDHIATFKAINRGQSGWRYCFRCRSMFFNGFRLKGVCPAGGSHVAAGFVFFLPHEHPGLLGGQPEWRFCDKCYSLFWAGDQFNQGRCHDGGGHMFNPRSFNFFLPHDHSGPGLEQWRCCSRCHVMFWDKETNKGVCFAGSRHQAAGNNYILDFSSTPIFSQKITAKV